MLPLQVKILRGKLTRQLFFDARPRVCETGQFVTVFVTLKRRISSILLYREKS